MGSCRDVTVMALQTHMLFVCPVCGAELVLQQQSHVLACPHHSTSTLDRGPHPHRCVDAPDVHHHPHQPAGAQDTTARAVPRAKIAAILHCLAETPKPAWGPWGSLLPSTHPGTPAHHPVSCPCR